MKKMIYCTAAILLFAITGCKKKVNISYEGSVYDSDKTNIPVAGVKVTLSACDGTPASGGLSCHGSIYTIGEATTDASGHFNIHVKAKVKNDVRYISVAGSSLNTAGGYLQKNLPSKLYMHP